MESVCKRKKDWLFPLLCGIAGITMISVFIFAGINNYGMEGDEVFSYISATSMGGFKGICYLDDQTWYDADYFKNALTATGQECFNLKMVVENQAMDVHPPLYYIFLNFVASIFSGKFSPWFGIGLNIFFMELMAIGLYLLLQFFLNNRYMSLFLCTLFCCSGLSLDMLLFIRMYVLLMALVVFQSWYHLILYRQILADNDVPGGVKKYLRDYLILMIITLLGALTQYYFLVYQCLIAAFFVIGLWIHKKYLDSFRYIGTMAVSGLIYICLYPAMLEHVFFKYRGREAVHKFLKEGTLFGDVISMFSSFDEKLYKGWLLPLLIILTLLTIVLYVRGKVEKLKLWRGLCLIFPALIYFFGISKASPFVSIRYVSPVAPLIYTAVTVWGWYLLEHVGKKPFSLKRNCMLFCLLLFFAVFDFQKEPVKEAYFTERKNLVDELAEEVDNCIYITGDEYNWKMWEDYVNYPQFQGLFFIDGRERQTISDKKVKEQETLVVYIDKALCLEEIYEYMRDNLLVKNFEIKYETAYTYIVLAK